MVEQIPCKVQAGVRFTTGAPLEWSMKFRRVYLYDSLSGILTHNNPIHKHHGCRAGTIDPNGYLRVQLQSRFFFVHNVIWELVTGLAPPLGFFVDHIDQNRLNNKWENLRLASKRQNRANSPNAKNKIHLKGVTLLKKRDGTSYKYRASCDGVYLGVFDTEQEAHEAYCKKAQENYGDYWSSGGQPPRKGPVSQR